MRLLQLGVTLYQTWARVAPRVRGRGAVLRAVDALQRAGLRAPLVTDRSGARFELGRDYVIRDVLFTRAWAAESTALLQSLTPRGGVFCDVGANVGYFSVLASQWVGSEGRVVAFEPGSETFARLSRNVAVNRGENITLLRQGCAAQVGRAQLVATTDPGHAYVAPVGITPGEATAAFEPGRPEPIELTTVDAAVQAHRLTRMDVLKIDTEGHDFDVLRGAAQTLQTLRPAVLLEVVLLERSGASAGDVEAYLSQFDYVCRLIMPRAEDMLCLPRERADGAGYAVTTQGSVERPRADAPIA